MMGGTQGRRDVGTQGSGDEHQSRARKEAEGGRDVGTQGRRDGGTQGSGDENQSRARKEADEGRDVGTQGRRDEEEGSRDRGIEGSRPGAMQSPIGNRQSAIGNSDFFILNSRSARRPAFSLLELMIAIVILGLGLVMVAAMFPVAWDRARELSEHTTDQAAAGFAHSTVTSLLEPAQVADTELMAKDPDSNAPPTPCSTNKDVPQRDQRVVSAGLAGDLVYDPDLVIEFGIDCPILYSDTRVHALHMENLPAVGNLPVAEEPWRLELVLDFFAPDFAPCDDPNAAFCPGEGFLARSFRSPQVRAAQRVYPPLESWTGISLDFAQLDNRRFCWAVLHRLRRIVGPQYGLPSPPYPLPQDAARTAIDEPRAFDMYYVTLRRPQPTSRYARQDPTTAPNPTRLEETVVVTPQALPSTGDVLLPVPWRVQVHFRSDIFPAGEATGVPTEVEVPPPSLTNASAGRFLVQMFPVGTKFIDEITGLIYTVAQRRVIGADGERAVLTLDTEVVREDVDLPPSDITCVAGCVPGVLDPTEQLRTVWVFPPPAEARSAATDPYPFLDGTTPVVDITVRTLTLAPNTQ